MQKPNNLAIVVFDNGLYGETGMQASHTSGGVDLLEVARGCGIERVLDVKDEAGLRELASLIGTSDRTYSSIDQSSPAYIAAMLRRMLDQRCLLTVQIGAHPALYTSALLEVVREAEYMVLDELTPKAGHRLLAAGNALHIRGLVDGTEVRFTSRVTQINTQDGLPFYKVPFPSSLEYVQRRQSPRVQIPLNYGVPVSILLLEAREFNGELRDISAHGLGMRVRIGGPDPAQDQGKRGICHIKISATLEIVTDINLCHIDPPVRGRVSRIGAQFVQLRQEQADRIERFCVELERQPRHLR